MEWGAAVTVVGTLLSGGLGGGFLVNLWAQHRQRQDRLDERRALRNDVYRSDLRQAHANFIGAYSKLLATADRFVVVMLVAQPSSRSEADAARIADTVEKAMNDFSAAEIEAQLRIGELLLLETDHTVTARLFSIYEAIPLRWPSGDDLKEYRKEVQTRRALLNEFVHALTGTFSPTRWEGRVAGTKSPAPSSAVPARGRWPPIPK